MDFLYRTATLLLTSGQSGVPVTDLFIACPGVPLGQVPVMTPLQDSWKAGIAPWVINITLRGYNLKARCGLRPAISIHFSYRIVTQIYAIMSSKSGPGWNNKQQVLTTLFNNRIQEYSMSQHQWGHGIDRGLQISLGPFTWVDSACYSVKNQNKTSKFMIILIIHEPFKVSLKFSDD